MKRPLEKTGRPFARVLRAALAVLAVAATACGQNPEATEKARGVLTGANIVVAMTVGLIVVAGGLLVGAVGFDRFVRTRKALEAAPPEPEEDGDEVVAGIGVGRAGVPSWLYGFYVLIPVFAFLYVVNNVALRPAAEEKPQESKAPMGPQTEVTVVASGIKFDVDHLVFPTKKDVSITFDNKDAGVPHNLTVWPSESVAQAGDTSKALLAGSNITGAAKKVEKFTTPDPGEYYFNCTVHPTSMIGTVEVVAG